MAVVGFFIQLDSVLAVLLNQLGVLEQVHLRRADEGMKELAVGVSGKSEKTHKMCLDSRTEPRH